MPFGCAADPASANELASPRARRAWAASVSAALAVVTLGSGCVVGAGGGRGDAGGTGGGPGGGADAPARERGDARTAAEAARREAEWYRQHLEASTREHAAKDARVAELEARLARLQAALDRVTAEHERVLEAHHPALSPDALEALASFARDHAHLASLDPSTGVLRLRCDAAFQPGGDALTREATQAAAALADVLGRPAFAPFQVRVAVHADNKPLPEEALVRHLRRENWTLTSRRAAAFGAALASSGLPVERLDSTGRGDRFPIAANATADGRAANRRLEISFALPPDATVSRAADPRQTAGADWAALDE